MSKVFVTKNGDKLIARDDIQAAAFAKAGLKEEKEQKQK